MPTPGMIATDMQQALRDLENTLQRISAALGLPSYEPPAVRHPDRAYVDMVRTRALADWLHGAADALQSASPQLGGAQEQATQAVIARLLAPLTKAELIDLADALGVAGVSESQRKDDIIAALVDWALATAED